jgi:hypothetical protein
MSITRNKLYNFISASKINIDFNNIEASNKKITKQLSASNLIVSPSLSQNTTIYHMESLYRNNSNDKYELSNKI